MSEDVEENTLRYICRECSFPGRAYIPRDQDVRGGILVLHGSEGGGFGTHDRTAVLLACHGFTALAYDWCGSYERPVDGLPSKVVDIAIEGPVKALRWLQRHESVRNKPVAIHGISRGAELAMIIATLSQDSMVPRLAAVSSLSGSDRIVQGFSWKWSKKTARRCLTGRLEHGFGRENTLFPAPRFPSSAATRLFCSSTVLRTRSGKPSAARGWNGVSKLPANTLRRFIWPTKLTS